MHNFFIKVIQQQKDFFLLKEQWIKVQNNSTNSSIFMCWEWHSLWWKHYAKNTDQLFIILIYDNIKLISIAPFYIQNNTSSTKNTLRFIATGEAEESEVSSEYLDVLIQDTYCKYKVDILKEIFNIIINYKPKIQNIDFSNILDGANVISLIEILNRSFYSKVTQAGLRYTIAIPKSLSHYISLLPANSFRKKIKRTINKFKSTQELKYEIVSELSKIDKLMPKLIDLHQDSWHLRGKLGAFYSEIFCEYHNDFIAKAAELNNVNFLILSVKDRIIGIFYFFVYDRTCYYYQSGIDRSFRPNYSPGYLGHMLMLQYCINNNFQLYDFMKGSLVNSYKNELSTKTKPMINADLCRKNLFGIFKKSTWFLKEYKYTWQNDLLKKKNNFTE